MFSPINQHSHAKSSEAIQFNLWTTHQGTKAAHNRFSLAWHVTWAPIPIGQSGAIITQKQAELAHYHPWEHPLFNCLVFSSAVWILKEGFRKDHEDFQKRHLHVGTFRPLHRHGLMPNMDRIRRSTTAEIKYCLYAVIKTAGHLFLALWLMRRFGMALKRKKLSLAQWKRRTSWLN